MAAPNNSDSKDSSKHPNASANGSGRSIETLFESHQFNVAEALRRIETP